MAEEQKNQDSDLINNYDRLQTFTFFVMKPYGIKMLPYEIGS